MSSSRLELLKSLVEEDPTNSFSRYGLAMEYARMGRWEQAVQEHRALLGINPDYVAAYFHGGQALEKMGRLEEARTLYQQGIEATTRIGDLHTRDEIRAALDLLG